MKMNPRLGAAAVCVVLALMLVPMPAQGPVDSAVLDLAHAPVFAVLAAVLHMSCRRWLPRSELLAALITWTGTTIFGIATEVAQGFVQRGPSFDDALANTLGAAAGVLWAVTMRPAEGDASVGEHEQAGRSPHGRFATRGLSVALVMAAQVAPLIVLGDFARQWWEMPRLASFEYTGELSRWSAENARMSRVPGEATDGQWSLRIDLQPAVYSGVQLNVMPKDWSGYDELLMDLHLDAGEPLDIVVKIHDLEHWDYDRAYDDRFHQVVRLEPGWQQVRVSLAEVEAAPRSRAMNLRAVCFLQLFTAHLSRPRTLHLDHVRLR